MRDLFFFQSLFSAQLMGQDVTAIRKTVEQINKAGT